MWLNQARDSWENEWMGETCFRYRCTDWVGFDPATWWLAMCYCWTRRAVYDDSELDYYERNRKFILQNIRYLNLVWKELIFRAIWEQV